MANNSFDSVLIRVHQLVFGGLLLGLAFWAAKGAMFGGTTNLKMIMAVVVAIGVVLALDKNYWILCPLLASSPIIIPGLPFDSAELGCLSLIGLFCVRSVLNIDKSTPIKKEVLYIAPYFLWVCIVWCMNPTGLAILGQSTIGARFYFKIVLAFITFLVVSRIYVSEKQCKLLFYGLMLAAVVTVISNLVGMGTEELSESIDTDAGSKYYIEAFGLILLLLLCRYDIGKIVGVGWQFFVAGILFVLVAYAGRRTMMGRVLFAPFILMYFKGKDKMKTVAIALFFGFLLSFVLVGQGRMYELPFSMQRAMSFLPAKWDTRLKFYGRKDLFREELHRRAKEQIRKNPWFGRKGFAMDRSETIWLSHSEKGVTYNGHEYAGNWHNKFYGMGADFGLFASFSWYFFSISALIICYRRRFLTENGTYRNAIFLYFSLFMMFDVIFAYGHSSITPFEQWMRFGIILALLNGQREQSDASRRI